MGVIEIRSQDQFKEVVSLTPAHLRGSALSSGDQNGGTHSHLSH